MLENRLSVRDGMIIATIRDVAKRAGVSVATVSAVVNNSKPVSEPLRQRVQEAIEALGYRQNLLARALYTKRTMTLAFLVPSIENPFFAEVLRAVEETAHANNYSVFVGSTNGDRAKVEFYRDRLIALGVDGVLTVLSWDVVSSDLIPALQAYEIPVVGVAGSRTLANIDCFVSDDFGAGEQAARYLLGLGHRQIAFIGSKDSQTTVLRYEGVKSALSKSDIEPDPSLLITVDGYEEADGSRAVSELIVQNSEFTAVVAFNDVMALGALSAFEDQGLSVPERLSVISFDDTISGYTRPRLTTVVCPKHDLGAKGVAKLLARIEGDDSPPQIHKLPTRILARESTRSPWVAHYV
jgi:DNA-binding LacI/PurR family transcriptional regulator